MGQVEGGSEDDVLWFDRRPDDVMYYTTRGSSLVAHGPTST